IAPGSISGAKITNLSITTDKIFPEGAEGYELRIIGGVVKWAAIPATTQPSKYATEAADYKALGAGWGKFDFAHGLPGIPQLVSAVLVCIVAGDGFVVGDDINVV